ncbi:MAG: sigma-54-dependent Fis family transcriptional regulator [Acidobacteria bacterium]|nr:sigma-54-dependent Fis family transcriptional regulator [Acidobacteriota bacterium]
MSVRRKTILVVDSGESTRQQLATPLKRDYRVVRAPSGEAALSVMDREEVDLVLADASLPGINGFELLRIVRSNYPLAESILVTTGSDLDGAVQAIKLGAYDYLSKDVDPDALRAAVGRASERQDLNRRVITLREEIQELGNRDFVAGQSRSMGEVLAVVQKVARLPATMLILGESGTGKELLARLIHREASLDSSGQPTERPFIAVNLAAIPRELVESTLFGHERGAFTGAVQQRIGKFELASGGTLFLDEIGDLRLELQAKLLRAIQEGEIERVGASKPIKTTFRLIAATNVDLERAVKDGTFRGDLFYRLNVIPVRLPPLRERLDDLPALAQFFLHRYNTRFNKQITGIAESTLRMLSHAWWPGNIRELENLIERMVATCDGDWITDDDLPLDFHVAELEHHTGEGSLLDRALATFERNYIIRALERNGWNVTQTARYLGVPLSTMKFKIDRLDIRDIARRVKGG